MAPASGYRGGARGDLRRCHRTRQVGVTTSFFDAGGNSLLAMRLASRAGTALAVRVSVRDVFEAPTVRGLIAATAGNAPDLPPVMAVVPRPERLPLSSVQRRMWFVNHPTPRRRPTTFRCRSGSRARSTSPRCGCGARHDRRHEVLRTRYPSDADGPYQQIADAEQVAAPLDWQICDSRDEALRPPATASTSPRILPRVRIWQ